jgi:ATP-dependent DNA helicase RecG
VSASCRSGLSPPSRGCVDHGRLKEVTKEHPHDITVAFHGLVDKGLLMREGSGRSTFYYRPGHHPMESGCSELDFEHLPGNSKHLDTLREIARPVRSVRKASRKVVEATILRPA